jgi:hypothetical protein
MALWIRHLGIRSGLDERCSEVKYYRRDRVGDDVLFIQWRPQNILMTQSGNYSTLTHSEGREGKGKGERRKRVNNRTGQSQVSTYHSIYR